MKGKSLEEMDAVFGDVMAQEEKARLFNTAALLGLTEPIRAEKLAPQVDEMEDHC